MRIIGIDPGTGILGFGVIDHNGTSATMVDAGVIRTRPHQPEQERLLEIFNGLEEIIANTQPHVMSVEKLFFARNVTTAMSVSQARGVVLLTAQRKDIPIFEYTPMQIKQALTGYGKADKKQIQEMVKIHLKLAQVPKPDDCADALAAALTHGAQAAFAQKIT
jgi:crossover junction endodeoxyribonuclease RuvC